MCFLRATSGSSVVLWSIGCSGNDVGDMLSEMSLVLSVVVVGCRTGPDYCNDGVMDISVVVDINVVDGIGTMSWCLGLGTDRGPMVKCVGMDVMSLQTYMWW